MDEHHEVTEERINRNWDELLQELRVTQTGVQILTGFLLTVPFSDRFGDLDRLQRNTYLAVLAGSVITTAFVVAPVAFHRVLFRHRMRRWLVAAANVCARVGLVMLAVTSSGAVFLVFDVVTERAVAYVALVLGGLLFAGLWGVAPAMADRRESPTGPEGR